MSLKDKIDKNKIPEHIAIIMDGNGRWAKQRGKMRIAGHNQGAKTLKDIIKIATELEIKYLTVYAFSTENWDRPAKEISGLLSLLVNSIDQEIENANKNGIKISVIGDISRFPKKVKSKIQNVVELTKNNKKLNVIIALSYSGRWEIVEASKKIAKDVKNNIIGFEDISEEKFSDYLDTSEIPDPELLIRTSGEKRISNFLLYQIAYTELYFTDVLWPDFSENELYKAILEYIGRERRFGKTSEQIK